MSDTDTTNHITQKTTKMSDTDPTKHTTQKTANMNDTNPPTTQHRKLQR